MPAGVDELDVETQLTAVLAEAGFDGAEVHISSGLLSFFPLGLPADRLVTVIDQAMERARELQRRRAEEDAERDRYREALVRGMRDLLRRDSVDGDE